MIKSANKLGVEGSFHNFTRDIYEESKADNT